MKIYISTDFTGHYPVGTAAIVVAESESMAYALLNAECKAYGLAAGFDGTFEEFEADRPRAFILNDGDY